MGLKIPPLTAEKWTEIEKKKENGQKCWDELSGREV